MSQDIPETQRQVLLRRYPEGVPETSDFGLAEGPVQRPGEGEFLSRTLYLSLDPYLRGVISGRHLYAERVQPGDVMPGANRREGGGIPPPRTSLPATSQSCSNGWQE